MSKKERRETALEYLRMLGLEKFADFYLKELSGGMKKRAQIAAVFANNPEVLLMDESFGSLDYPTKIGLQSQLQRIWMLERKLILSRDPRPRGSAVSLDPGHGFGGGAAGCPALRGPLPHPRSDELLIAPEFQEAKGELWEFSESRKWLDLEKTEPRGTER